MGTVERTLFLVNVWNHKVFRTTGKRLIYLISTWKLKFYSDNGEWNRSRWKVEISTFQSVWVEYKNVPSSAVSPLNPRRLETQEKISAWILLVNTLYVRFLNNRHYQVMCTYLIRWFMGCYDLATDLVTTSDFEQSHHTTTYARHFHQSRIHDSLLLIDNAEYTIWCIIYPKTYLICTNVRHR